ncbi:hypothetical protein TRVL_06252 [Trypanosoma vivax]|nr:hypothetical protein TRVL_06252 [Trypanosoma vivax]
MRGSGTGGYDWQQMRAGEWRITPAAGTNILRSGKADDDTTFEWITEAQGALRQLAARLPKARSAYSKAQGACGEGKRMCKEPTGDKNKHSSQIKQNKKERNQEQQIEVPGAQQRRGDVRSTDVPG